MSVKDCPRLAGVVMCFCLATAVARAVDPVATTSDAPTARVAAVPSTTPNTPPNISNLVGETETQFIPITAIELQKSKAALVAATKRLDTFLRSNRQRGDGWKNYLQWNQLQQQLSAKEPNIEQLRTVLEKFASTQAGLELSWFTDVKRTLRLYANQVALATNPQAEELHAERMVAIRSGIDAYLKNPSIASLAPVAEAVASLEAEGRQPQLVAKVREQYSRPNLLFQASEQFMADGIARPIDEVMPINDNLGGMHVTGTARTIGKVSAVLVIDENRAVVSTVMKGVNHSKTVGRNGPAIIYSRSCTTLDGEKRFYIDAEGIHDVKSNVDAHVSTQVTGVATNKGPILDRIIKRIAWRRIPKEKPKSEREAAVHAERMFATRLDAEAGASLALANKRFRDHFRRPLVLRDQFPPLFGFSTTKDDLRLKALHTGGPRFGAQTAPPELAGDPDLAVRAHESLVNNAVAGFLAGRTITRIDAEQLALEFLGELPPKMQEDKDQDPWSITFAAEPITLSVDDNIVEVTIRGDRYTSGNKGYDAMYVTVRYAIEHTGAGVVARRQGDLEIYPPGFTPGSGQQLALRQTVLRRLLQKRFGKIFEPEIVSTGLELPGEWSKVGKLWATQLVVDDGWLLVGWDRAQTADKGKPTKVAALPTSVTR